MLKAVFANQKLTILFFVASAMLVGFIARYNTWHDDSLFIRFDMLAKKSNMSRANDDLNIKKPTLIFTCLGTRAFSDYQSYIWVALEQVRLVNPNISLVVILSQDAYIDSIASKLNSLGVTVAFIDNLVKSNAMLQEFRRTFFEKGIMKPGGNPHFVQYAVERLIAVYAYMNQTGISNVFHIENDNMVYADLYQLVKRMYECNVSIAMARLNVNLAVTSFVFIRNSRSIEQFMDWCVNIFRMGPEKAVQFLGTAWVNDMALGARYLQLFAASAEQSKRTGVFELPTRFYSENESCCLCNVSNGTSIIFDACVLGQYFGGNFENPNAPYWEKNRNIDPRGLSLDWRPNELGSVKTPYIKGVKIINIHVHSKRLERFSSIGDKQTKGF